MSSDPAGNQEGNFIMMWKFFRRGTALALALCCLMGAVSCGGGTVPPAEEKEYITLIENGGTGYRMVVPRGDPVLFDLADRLAGKLETEVGVRIDVINDGHAGSGPEIVIGLTSRSVPEECVAAIETPDDWYLCFDGTTVILYSVSEASAREALAYFRRMLEIDRDRGTVRIESGAGYSYHSTATYLTLLDGQTNDCVIVCREEDDVYGEEVRAMIQRKCGVTLPVIRTVPDGCAILIGDMGTAEGDRANGVLPCVTDVGVVAVGNKLVLASRYDVGLANAVKTLEAVIKDYFFHGRWVLPESYHKIYEEKTEDLAAYIPMINANNPKIGLPKVERTRIYTPDGSDSAWYYSHHPFITQFKGKFYAIYSSGLTNEDDCKQRVMLATSENFTDWTVDVLVDSIMGETSPLVLYATGLYTDGETLTAFYTSYEYQPQTLRRNPDGSALRPEADKSKVDRFGPKYLQTTDGVHWSEAKDVTGSVGNMLLCGNLSPVMLASGRLMWAGYGSMAVSPSGNITGDWSGQKIRVAEGEEEPNSLTESGFFQRSDGMIFLFSRTDGGKTVCAASADEGRTWTDFYHTQLNDYGAKFEFGTLPDGRYYYIGNVDNKRSSVVLMISEDGISFNEWYILADEPYTQMKEGMYKGGVYGYPTTCFDSEYLYVIYSLHKESVEVLRVPLSEIGVR